MDENEIVPCPVCGSKEIESQYKSNGIDGPGYQQWITHEICQNCGVMLSPSNGRHTPIPIKTLE
jgi:hypothetical protein